MSKTKLTYDDLVARNVGWDEFDALVAAGQIANKVAEEYLLHIKALGFQMVDMAAGRFDYHVRPGRVRPARSAEQIAEAAKSRRELAAKRDAEVLAVIETRLRAKIAAEQHSGAAS